MEDVIISVNVQLLLLNRRLDGALGIKDVIELLKLHKITLADAWHNHYGSSPTYSTILGLRDDEEENNGLNSAPYTKHDVRLPGNVRKRNWDTELVGQQAYSVDCISSYL